MMSFVSPFALLLLAAAYFVTYIFAASSVEGMPVAVSVDTVALMALVVTIGFSALAYAASFLTITVWRITATRRKGHLTHRLFILAAICIPALAWYGFLAAGVFISHFSIPWVLRWLAAFTLYWGICCLAGYRFYKNVMKAPDSGRQTLARPARRVWIFIVALAAGTISWVLMAHLYPPMEWNQQSGWLWFPGMTPPGQIPGLPRSIDSYQ